MEFEEIFIEEHINKKTTNKKTKNNIQITNSTEIPIAEIKETMFNQILYKVRETFTQTIFNNIKTKGGNTQNAERLYQTIIRNILLEMNLNFTEAGSQQPYDFRIELPEYKEILNLEIKKTDNYTIYFNDTCPSEHAYYIIIFTGKTYKKKESAEPCIIGVNGIEFIKQCPWITSYSQELNMLKDKYKNMPGNMSVYPRPTYKSDIKFLIDKYNESKK